MAFRTLCAVSARPRSGSHFAPPSSPPSFTHDLVSSPCPTCPCPQRLFSASAIEGILITSTWAPKTKVTHQLGLVAALSLGAFQTTTSLSQLESPPPSASVTRRLSLLSPPQPPPRWRQRLYEAPHRRLSLRCPPGLLTPTRVPFGLLSQHRCPRPLQAAGRVSGLVAWTAAGLIRPVRVVRVI